MIVYLAYIKYDPEFSDLVSAHLSPDTAEIAALMAKFKKWDEFKKIYKDDPEELQHIEISHWVSPLNVQE